MVSSFLLRCGDLLVFSVHLLGQKECGQYYYGCDYCIIVNNTNFTCSCPIGSVLINEKRCEGKLKKI